MARTTPLPVVGPRSVKPDPLVERAEDDDAPTLLGALIDGTDRLLSLEECAGLVGFSEATVAGWIRAGRLRAFRFPGAIRVAASDLAAFLDERRREAVLEQPADTRHAHRVHARPTRSRKQAPVLISDLVQQSLAEGETR